MGDIFFWRLLKDNQSNTIDGCTLADAINMVFMLLCRVHWC